MSFQTKIEKLEFSTLERKIYDSVYSNAKDQYNSLKAQGLLGKKYTHVLAMLMKLRRAVLHPSLIIAKGEEGEEKELEGGEMLDEESNLSIEKMVQSLTRNNMANGGGVNGGPSEKFVKEVMEQLKGENGEAEEHECPICLTAGEQSVVIPTCMHIWFVVFSLGWTLMWMRLL